MNDEEILKIVIMQMLEHNRIHIGKYAQWGQYAKTNQLVELSALLGEAKHLVESENGALRKILDHLTSIDNVNS
jgi:hypothetical protein